MAKLIQPSMAGGEVSPPIGARVDLAKRQVAVERAENFVATFTGSMNSRPGQKFVARCKTTSGNHRIIEFEFNSDQTFVLELGEQYMRFHTFGGQILDSSASKTITNATQADPVVVTSNAHGLSNGDEVYIDSVGGMTELNGRSFLVAGVTTNTFELQDLNGDDIDGTEYTAYTSGGTATPPYEVETPWAASDLFELSYAQSGDVMTLVHPDYKPQELVRVANDNWTLSDVGFLPDVDTPVNVAVQTNTTETTTTMSAATQADPVEVTASGHGLSTGDRIKLDGVVGMTELNNFLYEVTVTSANTFELAYLDGTSVDGTGFTAYSSGGTVTNVQRQRDYTVTAVKDDDGEESLRGLGERDITITNVTQADPAVVTTSEGHGLQNLDEIEIDGIVGMDELNGERFQTTFIDATSFSLQRLDGTDVDSTAFDAYTSGGTANTMFVRNVTSADSEWDNTVSWDPVTGAQYYKVYASTTLGTFGFIGSTTKAVFEDVNLAPDYSVTPPILYNPFDTLNGGTGIYPSSTGFFGQRRWFANSDNNPNRFWATQIAHFDNFSRSIPPLSSDSIVAAIAARRINDIKHIVPLTDLIMLTSGGEYRITGGESGVITPSTINISPQSYYGTTSLRPIVAGDVGLFMSPGEFVRDLSFSIERGKFVGRDITILARHLFDTYSIVDWDFAPSPHSVAFCVRSDGVGLFFTYQPDQEVYAWTRATTQGRYKSVCVVREGDYDVVYVVVERAINGNTVKFIERLDERQFSALEDAFHVDAGLTLDNPITITGATAADPVVITAPSHGLSDGDTVDISGIEEVSTDENMGFVLSSDYNGTGFTVANTTTNTFELQNAGADYDGSDFAAYSSGGEVRKAVTTVSGLWHLEGATVVAAANGYAEKELTVSGGEITLGAPASRVHVGLGYTCQLKTLPVSTYGSSSGPTQGRSKNASRLTVQVHKTMGMWYGPTEDQMYESVFGLPALYGQPLPMVTEDIDVTLKSDWDKEKRVVIEQRDPLPLSVLTIIPDVTVGGN